MAPPLHEAHNAHPLQQQLQGGIGAVMSFLLLEIAPQGATLAGGEAGEEGDGEMAAVAGAGEARDPLIGPLAGRRMAAGAEAVGVAVPPAMTGRGALLPRITELLRHRWSSPSPSRPAAVQRWQCSGRVVGGGGGSADSAQEGRGGGGRQQCSSGSGQVGVWGRGSSRGGNEVVAAHMGGLVSPSSPSPVTTSHPSPPSPRFPPSPDEPAWQPTCRPGKEWLFDNGSPMVYSGAIERVLGAGESGVGRKRVCGGG